MAFHQNVSVAMGTALQHLADSIFVNMANLVLLHRDSYFEHIKQGIKSDTLNQLRNVPLFSYGLSQMQSSVLLNRILLILKPPVLLRDPARVLRSSLVGGPHIDTDLMKRRNINLPAQEIKSNNHGGSLVALGDGVVAEVVVQIPVSLGPVDTSN